MTEFVSAADAAESASYVDQKTVTDEVVEMQYRIRREMDQGLTPDEMSKAQAAKAAAEAAREILSKIF